MREGRSIPLGMENGEVDPAEQGRTFFGLAEGQYAFWTKWANYSKE
jgi:hypothetical protein